MQNILLTKHGVVKGLSWRY